MRTWTGCAAAAAGLVAAGCGSGGSSTPGAPPTSSSTAASTTSVGAQSAGGSARLVIDPTHGQVGTTLHVTGSGYAPGVTLSGALCAVDAQGVVQNPLSDCDVLDVVTVTTDQSGGFTTTYAVKRIPPAKAGYQLGFGRPGDAAQSAGAAFTVDAG